MLLAVGVVPSPVELLGSWPEPMAPALPCSASGMEVGKIEEMEKMLKEAHAEKSRLMESRVSGAPCLGRAGVLHAALPRLHSVVTCHGAGPRTCTHAGSQRPCPAAAQRGLSLWLSLQEREMELRRQALEDERRRREQLERRLQDETAQRQKLVEKEVKMREKHFSQVRLGRRGGPSMALAQPAGTATWPSPLACSAAVSGEAEHRRSREAGSTWRCKSGLPCVGEKGRLGQVQASLALGAQQSKACHTGGPRRLELESVWPQGCLLHGLSWSSPGGAASPGTAPHQVPAHSQGGL